MNIATVADNLRNTIAGKEVYLNTLQNRVTHPADSTVSYVVNHTTIAMLDNNIAELKKILTDVEACVAT